jgi:hypothetical protein
MSASDLTLSGSRADIAESFFHVEGQPFSLEHWPMFYAIYDGNYSKILLKCARQLGKSTSIACFMLAECMGIPHFKAYYLSPSKEQTLKFSHTRVAKILAYSPLLRKGFAGPESIDNVLLRTLNNGSEMAFTYGSDDADRARGYSADRALFDEIQDIQYESVVPVVEEAMSASKYGPFSIYAGTPKTSENGIEFLWQLSTQSEWCMKCSGCGNYTFVDNIRPLGLEGPVCLKCSKNLNPREGRWIDMKPDAKIKGFHISQAIMPRNVAAAWPTSDPRHAKALIHWSEFLDKQTVYGETKFFNECLGVSTSTGVKLLTKEILEELCDERVKLSRLPENDSMLGISKVTAGVDWSGGGGEIKGSEGMYKSRTVLHVGGQQADGRFRTLYYRIFPNGHMLQTVEEIAHICDAWNVSMIVGDAGEGQLANAELKTRLGVHRVVAVRYMNKSKPMDWSPESASYHCDRSSLIDNWARAVLLKQFLFGPVVAMKPAINDILSVYEETTVAGKKVWRHPPNVPDDFLHAHLFSWLAWRMLCRDLEFY